MRAVRLGTALQQQETHGGLAWRGACVFWDHDGHDCVVINPAAVTHQ